MKFKNLLFVMFFFLFATSMFAQEVKEEKKESKSTFSLDGEFRNRFELSPSLGGRNIIVPENTQAGASFWQRSRITATYKSDKLETKFSLQDVRPFMANDLGWKSNNGTALAVYEAWAKFYLINNENKKLGLKIGRQEVFNSDARLIWNKNWDHYGGAWDAITFECDNKEYDLKWNLGLSLNSAEAPGFSYTDKDGNLIKKHRTLGFFNFSKKFGKSFTFNVSDLMEGFDEELGLTKANYVRNTIGINPVFKKSGFTFNGSFYYQHGTPNTFIGTTLNPVKYAGMMYTANVSYKINKYTVGAGYDNYSGEAYDDDGTDYKNKVFITPCAGAHKFFGFTDIHLKLFGKKRGLQDINLKVNAALSKTTKLSLAFHNISFAETNVYTDATSGNDVEFTSVGNDIDFVLNHVLGKKMSVTVGYSVLLPSEEFINSYSWGQSSDAKFHGWGWVMFSFKPNFLKVVK